MANLTKDLRKLSKQKIDPIQEELMEQFESARFNRFLAKFRTNDFEKQFEENKNLVLHIN
jgi:hypothetical protein